MCCYCLELLPILEGTSALSLPRSVVLELTLVLMHRGPGMLGQLLQTRHIRPGEVAQQLGA